MCTVVRRHDDRNGRGRCWLAQHTTRMLKTKHNRRLSTADRRGGSGTLEPGGERQEA
jgi:hypothetical protein